MADVTIMEIVTDNKTRYTGEHREEEDESRNLKEWQEKAELGDTIVHFLGENCMKIYRYQSPEMSMPMLMIFISSPLSYLSITKGWKEIDQKLNSFAAI